jgi:hypothetical protein
MIKNVYDDYHEPVLDDLREWVPSGFHWIVLNIG